MAYQLEFSEEYATREAAARHLGVARGPAAELRRAYDALMELAVGGNIAVSQAYEEYRDLYLAAFQTYTRGDLQGAEYLARAVKHLCRAAWFDAKIKHLESHGDDFPHIPGLNKGSSEGIERGLVEIESRLSRLKLMGMADRFGHRCRKHLERVESMHDRNTLVADTFIKAAFEYCLATEVLHTLEFSKVAAA